MPKITDPRIGYRNEAGKLVYPTRYVTGKFWNRGATPEASRWYIHDEYFVVLPQKYGVVPDDVRAKLRALVGAPEPVSTTGNEAVVEPVSATGSEAVVEQSVSTDVPVVDEHVFENVLPAVEDESNTSSTNSKKK